MSDIEQNDAQLSPLLEYFAERLNLVFAYFFCEMEFADDEYFKGNPSSSDRAWSLQTIENACLQTSLIALRDLDDFFNPRTSKSRPDDLKASDFGFCEALTFLAEQDRMQINKYIAHTTLPGAKNQNVRWDIYELSTKGILQAFHFLMWTEDQYRHSHVYLYTAALCCRKKSEAIWAFIEKEIERKKEVRPGTAQ